MSRTDLVVSVGADQEQMSHRGLTHKIFEEVEGGSIEPLQVVEKQHEWLIPPRERRDDSCQEKLKATLRIMWR
jgi:hypothetical protein